MRKLVVDGLRPNCNSPRSFVRGCNCCFDSNNGITVTRFSTRFFPRISKTFLFYCDCFVCIGAYRSVVKVYWYDSLGSGFIYNHCSPRDLGIG